MPSHQHLRILRRSNNPWIIPVDIFVRRGSRIERYLRHVRIDPLRNRFRRIWKVGGGYGGEGDDSERICEIRKVGLVEGEGGGSLEIDVLLDNTRI